MDHGESKMTIVSLRFLNLLLYYRWPVKLLVECQIGKQPSSTWNPWQADFRRRVSKTSSSVPGCWEDESQFLRSFQSFAHKSLGFFWILWRLQDQGNTRRAAAEAICRLTFLASNEAQHRRLIWTYLFDIVFPCFCLQLQLSRASWRSNCTSELGST